MQQSSVLNSQIIEGLQAVETIKGNANEESELESIEKEYIKSLRIELKEGMISNVQGAISEMVSTVGNLVMMYCGIMQVINSHITLGALMAFITLTGYFMDPIGRLVGLQLQIQEANISMKRMAEILDYNPEQSEMKNETETLQNLFEDNKKDFLYNKYNEIKSIEGDIEIKNVTFRYGNRKPALYNLSFTIPKGKKVALVGSSGSGKSTIAKMLLKYYEPEEGEILFDGMDIQEIDNHSLRRAISYVPQNIELFSKSIYDNIRVSRMNATLEEVKEAAKAADAHEFIKKLPMQYYTYLEEAGDGLSGGEKQRIALARAFLKDNSFYILDESTSNLDFGTEKIIFDMIYNKFINKSMLIIAHRLATVKNCDEIIAMDHGRIVEKGTHDNLLVAKGRYYELWQLQQGDFKINAKKLKMETLNSENQSAIANNKDEMMYLEGGGTIKIKLKKKTIQNAISVIAGAVTSVAICVALDALAVNIAAGIELGTAGLGTLAVGAFLVSWHGWAAGIAAGIAASVATAHCGKKVYRGGDRTFKVTLKYCPRFSCTI